MVRPVKQIASGAAELIGTLEQNNMSIRVPDGGEGGTKGLKFTHTGGCGERLGGGRRGAIGGGGNLRFAGDVAGCWSLALCAGTWAQRVPRSLRRPAAEFHTSSMLSVVASLTPYSDFNQSPRNMYQCQMAKQTMGTPAQARGVRWLAAAPCVLLHCCGSAGEGVCLLPARPAAACRRCNPVPCPACPAPPCPHQHPPCHARHTFAQALAHRTDNKMYRIQNPQTPIARTQRCGARPGLRGGTAPLLPSTPADVCPCSSPTHTHPPTRLPPALPPVPQVRAVLHG